MEPRTSTGCRWGRPRERSVPIMCLSAGSQPGRRRLRWWRRRDRHHLPGAAPRPGWPSGADRPGPDSGGTGGARGPGRGSPGNSRASRRPISGRTRARLQEHAFSRDAPPVGPRGSRCGDGRPCRCGAGSARDGGARLLADRAARCPRCSVEARPEAMLRLHARGHGDPRADPTELHRVDWRAVPAAHVPDARALPRLRGGGCGSAGGTPGHADQLGQPPGFPRPLPLVRPADETFGLVRFRGQAALRPESSKLRIRSYT